MSDLPVRHGRRIRVEKTRRIARPDNGMAAMTLDEIAKEMGCSKSAVNVTLRRGLKRLRKHGLMPELLAMAATLDTGRRGATEWNV